jgi:VanZ family protein
MKTTIRWVPAILLMVIVFILSSIPAVEMPSFGFWDTLAKKGGHALGYGILALSYWFALKWDRRRVWLAFGLVVVYALSDEFHQSFVPGRHSSLMDALGFDAGGALIMLIGAWGVKRKRIEQ